VLRAHCDAIGRDYDQIEKTVSGPLDPGPGGQNVNALIGRMRDLAKLGITHYQGAVPNVASITPLEMLGRRVIPVAAEL
jgi:alkanesulfonate monooxygenase